MPLAAGAPSRLSGRILFQEAVGDQTILNPYNRYYGNSLGGRGLLGPTYDSAPGFAQVRAAGATAPYAPFMYSATGLKASVAPATGPAAGPTEGYFQFGTTAAPASHTMLLDGTAYTPLAVKQMSIWLLTGRVADPADTTNWPIAQPWEDIGQPLKAFPSAYPE
jgi:hypothetical protein